LPWRQASAGARVSEGWISMRRSILATVLAVVAQVAWAQDSTDTVIPEVPDTEVQSEGTASETAETEVATESETTEETTSETEVAEETEVVEETETEVEVTEDLETDVVVDEDEPVSATDNRSSTGQFHGGHRGSVSTLARAGLGPVFGKLRSQGYGDIQIEQVGDDIMIEALSRSGQVRRLTYDATTGALVSDEQGEPNPLRALANTFRKDRAAGAATSRGSQKSWGKDAAEKTKGVGNGQSKGVSGSSNRGGNGHGAGSNAGGNGKGNGGGNGKGGGNGGGRNK
jgi:hypothetical protein